MTSYQKLKADREPIDKEKMRQYMKMYYQKHREEMLRDMKKYYLEHREQILKHQYARQRKRKEKIKQILGNQCAVCGSPDNLVFHHLDYSEANQAYFPSFKELKKGDLVLVCRRHHRAIHFINELRFQGYLPKILGLLNNKPRANKTL
jgi:galactose-1-phosphate uridylyltransferase